MNDEGRRHSAPATHQNLRSHDSESSGHSPRRDLIERALDALEDGDHELAVDLLVIALDDRLAAPDPNRCLTCGRWPGERWACHCTRVEAA
jgi:hypothetical protein